MIINENIRLNSSATVTNDKGYEIQVVSLNSSLDSGCTNFNLNITIMDKASTDANKAIVQEQINSFLEAIRNKMVELGYSITI